MLVHVIDFRSRHTVTHTVTTAWTAYEIARRLMADEAERGRVYCAALLHDVGKIGIPLGILEKPGRLDAREMAVMRTHVTLTESILAGCVPNDIAAAAARHHEKLDGSGYPRGLAAVDLKMADRIIAVADIVSALVGTRSYKEAFPKERVLEVLADQRDRGLIDGSCVAVMVRDYDEVMAVVQRACLPVAALYERVQQEYRWLLDQLARHEAGPLTEPAAPVG
ncbi:MAG: HD domain-containing phosphohydrolase [Gordonibacter pamelaeae]